MGSTANFGFRFLITASGGVICFSENLGNFPCEALSTSRSPPPPPPPACVLAGFSGIVARINQQCHLRFGFDLGHNPASENRGADDQADHDHVSYSRTQSAILLIVVEAPNILHGIWLRFQLQRGEFLGKEEFVQAAEKRLVQRLKSVGSQQEMKLRLAARVLERSLD